MSRARGPGQSISSGANGASMFFIVVYIHIFRGLYYGSYKAPRELLWMLGVVIFLLMMATAFMGYVLPWGQMSYWGAQVITGQLASGSDETKRGGGGRRGGGASKGGGGGQ